MAFQMKNNTGYLFINNRKGKDSHPDKTGTIMIDGVEYVLSGWDKNGQQGEYTSLSVKKKEDVQQQAKQASFNAQKPVNNFDDTPF